jgi:uncharacterized protein (TIGR00299 family) protein
MMLAALLDAGAPRDAVTDAVSSVLGRRIEVGTRTVTRRGLRALELLLPEGLDRAPAGRGPLDLAAVVERAGLADGVRTHALAVLSRLGDAEARVHGVSVAEVHLEELGADDTLVDVVGVAAALDALDVGTIAVPAVPLGRGARATLELLRGFDVRPPDVPDELPEPVTPTGAAILSALGEPAPEMPEMRLEAVGVGAGARDPAGVANVVRVLLGTPAGAAADGRRLVVVEANVDDMSPELAPDAIEALLQTGALDAWFTPIVMKHGRPALTISALCEPDDLAAVRRAFFEHTTTLGFRVHGVARPELERRVVEIELAEGGPRVRVKVAYLDGRAVSAKPEHEDVVEAARKLDRPVRAVHEAASALAHRLLEEPA